MAGREEFIYHSELIIHPGETINEVIIDRNITQRELALRTGFTEKHISTVISGKKNISVEFSKMLEYALDIDASFWRNLQTNYDMDLLEYKDKNYISDVEISVAKEVYDASISIMGIENNLSKVEDQVIFLRHKLSVSNLEILPKLTNVLYRAQFNINTSENLMYVWEYLTVKKALGQTNNQLDVEKLKNNLVKLKKVMFEQDDVQEQKIREILNESGILFVVEEDIKGAPIKGLTLKTKENQLVVVLTKRGRYKDIFWFTLFHEIGHIINQDYSNKTKNERELLKLEKSADDFSKDYLINKTLYSDFIKIGDFEPESIDEFARLNDVTTGIVYGRLMNDKLIPWSIKGVREKF